VFRGSNPGEGENIPPVKPDIEAHPSPLYTKNITNYLTLNTGAKFLRATLPDKIFTGDFAS
jgi:hypothetical protein